MPSGGYSSEPRPVLICRACRGSRSSRRVALSLSGRRIIAGLLQRKVSVARIALQRGRHRSTIHRDICSYEGQARELVCYLPERRKRKARYAHRPASLVFPKRCMIRNRPQTVEDRQIFWH